MPETESVHVDKIVEAFNDRDDESLLQLIQHHKTVLSDSHDLTLTVRNPSSISSDHFESCFNLIRENLQTLYESSSWGWNPESKRAEMQEPGTRFLLVLSHKDSPSNGQRLLGFLSFQVVNEDGVATVYCYELQTSPEIRRRGIGRQLMDAMHQIALQAKVSRAMLTVFTANHAACSFYHKLQYTEDESSPKERLLRGRKVKADYAILSKPLI